MLQPGLNRPTQLSEDATLWDGFCLCSSAPTAGGSISAARLPGTTGRGGWQRPEPLAQQAVS